MNGLTSTQEQDLGFLAFMVIGTAVLAVVASVKWAVDRFRGRP